MKKYFLILVIIITFFYLNRSYAHIYDSLGDAHFSSPDKIGEYVIGSDTLSSKTLTYDALGDSLTAGVGLDDYRLSFPYLIGEKISDGAYRVELKDRSSPGSKSKDFTESFLISVVEDRPDIITLFIGVNDVHGNVSPKEFSENYEKILKHLTEQTRAKIYVINLPYIGSPDLILFPYNLYFDWRTMQFNKAIRKASIDYNVTYIDLYKKTALKFKTGGPHYSSDLFHPSAQGYSEWADIIYAYFN